ncbi:MAG TPA: flagellar filament capping protein FliD, partial [Polyangiaceae bacterium]|nr:flagellar filament capping protein FliD [Polyangiaceae bacterium]
ALSTTQGLSSFTASSSGAAVVASANGNALPASYSISVGALAKEQRTYSAKFSTSSDPLNQTGTLAVKIGSGTATNIGITATDSLDSIAAKINATQIRASASVFYDGTAYRLQIRGVDTGAANALTLTETGTSLDLNGDGSTPSGGKTVQSATDASLSVDGFTITRSTNQIVGVVPGVTLALTAETTSPVTVSVATDPNALRTKVSAFVNAFNGVINSIHTVAGYGTQKASNSTLAADSTLRSVNDRLNAAARVSASSGTFRNLNDIGISLNRDGTLKFDESKFVKAMSADAASVVAMLARPAGATSGGLMADLKDIAASLTASDTGMIATHGKAFDARAKTLDLRATSEQARLDSYATNLRKQFTAMNQRAAASNQLGTALLSALNKG